MAEKISRQRKMTAKRVAQGLCAICSKPRNFYQWRCDACAEKQRQRVRTQNGYQPWQKGKRGRPPKRLPEQSQ